jgi:hypothetical protein
LPFESQKRSAFSAFNLFVSKHIHAEADRAGRQLRIAGGCVYQPLYSRLIYTVLYGISEVFHVWPFNISVFFGRAAIFRRCEPSDETSPSGKMIFISFLTLKEDRGKMNFSYLLKIPDTID